jgi:hypothetical protein
MALRSKALIIEAKVAAKVAELVDALGLGPSAARHGGSSPFLRTIFAPAAAPAGALKH